MNEFVSLPRGSSLDKFNVMGAFGHMTQDFGCDSLQALACAGPANGPKT